MVVRARRGYLDLELLGHVRGYGESHRCASIRMRPRACGISDTAGRSPPRSRSPPRHVREFYPPRLNCVDHLDQLPAQVQLLLRLIYWRQLLVDVPHHIGVEARATHVDMHDVLRSTSGCASEETFEGLNRRSRGKQLRSI